DLDTIKENHWLNDTIIEFYMEYKERTEAGFTDAILLLRPAMVQLLTHSSEDPNLLKTVLPPNLDTREVVFAPINDGSPGKAYDGSHWSLVVFFRPTKRYYYYDSMGTGNFRAARKTARKLAPLLGEQASDLLIAETPQQGNGADCGGKPHLS
ncbi:cysteine proteinase, partial [Hesseltinella vesiculosa]